MEIDKTVIEWAYEPSSYFESSMIFSEKEYDIRLENGLASITLSYPQDPVPEELINKIIERLELIFLSRQLFVHKPFILKGHTINHINPNGSKSIQIKISETATVVCSSHAPDVMIKDKDGNIIHDSRAIRIAEQYKQVKFILTKYGNNELAKTLLGSYGRAVSDPADELVHLYEIRDALSKAFGGEDKAIKLLGVSKNKWDRLGILANVEPLEEGRHRGKHSSRRIASHHEIQEARDIARELILGYVNTL
jgi:hypothetical protein